MEERVNITVRASKSLALREFLERVIELKLLGYDVDVDPTSSGYPRARSNGNVFSVDMVLGDNDTTALQDKEEGATVEVIEDTSKKFSAQEDDSSDEASLPEDTLMQPGTGNGGEQKLTYEEKLSAIDAASKKVGILALAAQWGVEVPTKMKRPTQIQAYLRKVIKED